MAIMDFGRIASALKDSINNNANKEMSLPYSTGPIGTKDHNFSSAVDSIINGQIILGRSNTFLWGSHTWDDAKNRVS